MSNKLKPIARFQPYFFLLMALIFCCSSCKKEDDDQILDLPPLVYDAATFIHGTMMDFGVASWETIIDLESGRFDTIPGTKGSGGGFNLPLGTKELTDFAGNRRIFVDLNGEDFVIQDLTTGVKIIIELRDPVSGNRITRLENLNFGASTDEVYGIAADKVGYRINLTTKAIEIAHDGNGLDLNQVNDFVYIKEGNYLVYLGQNNSNGVSQYAYSIYDIAAQQIAAHDTMPELFGFVKYLETNRIYCLAFPSADKGFRLTELEVNDSGIFVRQLSSTDLAIDKLSANIQTIHTATNSYICRGGNTSFDATENILYSVDLNSGQLTSEVLLENFASMINITSE